MKSTLLTAAFLCCFGFISAQINKDIWQTTTKKNDWVALENRLALPEHHLFTLDATALKTRLQSSPNRFASSNSAVVISLPNSDGVFEQFRVYENPIMEQGLSARYPDIKSYVGIGITNPAAKAYFSMSPLGFRSMVLAPDRDAVFIEPVTADYNTYTVYRKKDKAQSLTPFECSVVDDVKASVNPTFELRPNADDSQLRTFRLAMSCTGEYTAYFGGTKAQALAAINNSITRCNGVFEMDFGVRLVIIANTDLVIYTNASTDPYSPASSMSNWNSQLQSTLTSVIGEANYDVGHLFGATGGGGNAGCIGCVCVDGSKGRGYTSPADGVPMGDKFDIDYVAHELGHQFGANHTFTHSNETGTGAQMEPGSGSTIMGYAGITTKDVQLNSDAYFHAISIQQVTNNIKTKSCQTNTPTGNNVPTANAGLDYTIPKSTPFMLTGLGTDADGDVLTYCWEQMNLGTSTTSTPTATATAGPLFRSYTPTTNPSRSFPRMETVLAGATTTSGYEIPVEVLPSVARTLNFRFTVRDNRAGGSANNSDDTVITVNGTAGPFTVTSPNTAVSYVGGSTQTITWNVAGTTANGVNCANVDILLSTDGGTNWTTLLTATPNDGAEALVIPNTPSNSCRIMVKGNNHIFFDVSNTNFTITLGTAPDTTPPTAPTLTASGTTTSSTNLSWSGATDNVGVTGYDVYQNGAFLASTSATNYAVTGLASSTTYTFYVRAKDAAGNISPNSNTVSVTTLTPADTTPPSTPLNLVASGTTQTTTTLTWTASTDNVGVTGYEVFSGNSSLGTVAGTTANITGLTAATAYTFKVRAYDAAGNLSAFSNTVNVTTLSNALTYCASRGNSTADEFINRVQIGSINNLSGNNGGYANFTNLSTTLVRGTSNTITITPGWTSSVFSEAYRVWIDYNQDGDFLDAGEQVVNVTKTTASSIARSFTVPSTATLGSTRMRVSMKYNASPTSCETFSYGEVEDYTVIISATAREEMVTSNQLDITLYPNPVRDGALYLAGLTDTAAYRIINMLGQEVAKGTVTDQIAVHALQPGVYLLELQSQEGNVTKRFIKE